MGKKQHRNPEPEKSAFESAKAAFERAGEEDIPVLKAVDLSKPDNDATPETDTPATPETSVPDTESPATPETSASESDSAASPDTDSDAPSCSKGTASASGSGV